MKNIIVKPTTVAENRFISNLLFEIIFYPLQFDKKNPRTDQSRSGDAVFHPLYDHTATLLDGKTMAWYSRQVF